MKPSASTILQDYTFKIEIFTADNCYKFLGCHAHTTLDIGTTVFQVINTKVFQLEVEMQNLWAMVNCESLDIKVSNAE